MVECCNTPHVTFQICNPNSCHFRLCVMIFPPWSGFFFRFVFCSCHAFHIMSSCALHLHTCSSHASEHLPRCPFRIRALLSPSVVLSTFLSCVGVKHFRIGPRVAKRPWFTTVDRLSSFVPFELRLVLQRLTEGPKRPRVCCSPTHLQSGTKPT